MLRKMRIDGPASALSLLVDTARGAGLDIDDWAIDTSTEYGWPSRGDGKAYVLVVIDDDAASLAGVVDAMRAVARLSDGGDGCWIEPGGTFVYLPDGMEPEWYPPVAALAERLHDAEACGDEVAQAALRHELLARIDPVIPLAERRWSAFTALLPEEGSVDRDR